MNLRVLKKRCKRAMEVLIAEHGYRRADFASADGSESLYAPLDLDEVHVRFREWSEDRTYLIHGGFITPGVLPGTPLLWERTSYEYDEWDARLPSAVLRDIIEARHTNWAKMMAEFYSDPAP